ncbi:MAG: hypothetical protein P8163_17520 [Candidatus Thiodiazotropha sp.]
MEEGGFRLKSGMDNCEGKLKNSGLSIVFGLAEEATYDWDGKKCAFTQANKEDIHYGNETYS